MLGLPWDLILVVYGTHKGDELSRDDPVEVSVFYLFIVFVLSRVEILEAVPAELVGYLKAFQTVINLKFK